MLFVARPACAFSASASPLLCSLLCYNLPLSGGYAFFLPLSLLLPLTEQLIESEAHSESN